MHALNRGANDGFDVMVVLLARRCLGDPKSRFVENDDAMLPNCWAESCLSYSSWCFDVVVWVHRLAGYHY